MRDLMIIFAILLLVLVLISAFGGGIRLREPFEEEPVVVDVANQPDLVIQPKKVEASLPHQPEVPVPEAYANASEQEQEQEQEAQPVHIPEEYANASEQRVEDELEGFDGSCAYAGCM